MNEKLQYASMLEIPVSTCTVSVKEQKKKGLFKKKKQQNTESVKEELIEKVNEEVENPFSLLPDVQEEKEQEPTEEIEEEKTQEELDDDEFDKFLEALAQQVEANRKKDEEDK